VNASRAQKCSAHDPPKTDSECVERPAVTERSAAASWNLRTADRLDPATFGFGDAASRLYKGCGSSARVTLSWERPCSRR